MGRRRDVAEQSWAERIPAALEKAEREVRLHERQFAETGAAFGLDITAGEVALAKTLWDAYVWLPGGGNRFDEALLAGRHPISDALRAFVEKVEGL
jgi:hypothetical protein